MLRFALFAAVVSIACAVPLHQTEPVMQATTPPMGWRSWNAFLLDVDQKLMLAQVDAVAAPGPNGGKSLSDLGFGRIGIDDGWQDCGAGVNHSFHDAAGKPLINSTRFPDMLAMTRYAHSKKVKMGWYLNNCWCNEQGHEGPNYQQDVDALLHFEFDGVKIDGCGPAHDINKWTKTIADAKGDVLIENCGDNHKSWSPPLPSELETCTFNLYRVSSDIAPQFYSTMSNLQRMVPFQALDKPMSRPGCWAYPDMLQVGNNMNDVESRSHFGAWCVTSSPLILGFDLTNKNLYTSLYPLLSNEHAIGVNQAWNGHPGRLLLSANATFPAPVAHGAECSCCSDVTKCDKEALPEWQVWTKPLQTTKAGKQQLAIFVVNISEKETSLQFSLGTLGINTKQANKFCVWCQKDFGLIDSVKIDKLAAHDSIFWILTEQ